MLLLIGYANPGVHDIDGLLLQVYDILLDLT